MQTQKNTTVNVVHRLSPEAYAQVEKACFPIHVSVGTTDLQVSYTLGQQSVLKFLRENIVVGA